jgi:DNA repair ATPase RecN
VFVVAEPAAIAGVDPFSEADRLAAERADVDPRVEMQEFFDRMTDLLDRAARKHGTNPTDVLPTQDEIKEAVQTRTMHSDQSQKVMLKLREGFDYYDLEWPTAIPER